MQPPRKFLTDQYLNENWDLKESLGEDAVANAASHYQDYGRGELRGYENVDSTYNIETVLTSLSGFVFLSGWINRKLHSEFDLTIRIGYEELLIPREKFAFYRREDVSRHLEEPHVRAAFVCLFSVDAPIRATTVSFKLGRRENLQLKHVTPLSGEGLLQAILGRVSYLAQLPASNTHAACSFLCRALKPLWKDYLESISFSEVYSSPNKRAGTYAVSFVTVLYNELTLLRPQMILTGHALPREDVEWIVVLNRAEDIDALLREVAGLDRLVPFKLKVVVSSGNSGFAAANNHGASLAQSARIALINPDVFPNPASRVGFDALVNVPLPKDTLLGTQLVYGTGALMHDGMYIAQNDGYDEETRAAYSLLRVEHYGKGSVARGTDKAAMRPVQAVTGAFWQMQQESFFKAGAISTDYLFAHYEDADFCLRIWDKGGQVQVFEPAALMHLEGVGSHNSPAGLSMRWINRCLFSERWGKRFRGLGPSGRAT